MKTMRIVVAGVATLFVATTAFAALSKDDVKRLNESALLSRSGAHQTAASPSGFGTTPSACVGDPVAQEGSPSSSGANSAPA
jgi:hypothetical protein